MAAIFTLPQELLVKVIDHVATQDLPPARLVCSYFETATNPRFAKELLAKRRHAMSRESISTLNEIASHTYFGSFVDTIILNCVRTADHHSSTKYDDVVSALPYQVDAEETSEETSSKHFMLVNVIRTIKENHGKINIGVCLENSHEDKPCFGLGQIVSKGSCSTAKRAIYSPNHVKHNLKALLQTCKQQDCPVLSIEVDLGTHASECYDGVAPWRRGAPTLYRAIEEVYKGSVTPNIGLNLKYGIEDSRGDTFFYDSVAQTLRHYRSSSMRKGRTMGYLFSDPRWLAATPVSILELDGHYAFNSKTLKLGFVGFLYSTLEKITLRNMIMRMNRDWSLVMRYLSEAPILKSCYFTQLSSILGSPPDGQQYARFLDIIEFEADGPDIRTKLQELAARLQTSETAWRSEPLDSPTKWAKDLGAKIGCETQDQIPLEAEEDQQAENNIAEEDAHGDVTTITNNNSPSAPTYNVAAICGVKRKREMTVDQIGEHQSQDVHHFTVMRRSLLEVPKHMRRAVYNFFQSGSTPSTGIRVEHPKKLPYGEAMAMVKESAGLVKDKTMLQVREHSSLFDSILNTLYDETTHSVTQTKSRYILEEVRDLGDTDYWAEDLCTRINTISLEEEHEVTPPILQRGSVIFEGAVRAKISETDSWVEEIGWNLDQVFQKHCQNA